ncbi:hypothetical protein PTKIN_Ptkin10aG0072000 [Pterospermum kingtungense]
MFDIFFGWRKASKCKKLIKRVQSRLKLLKNKRHTIVKQLREDVAQLIKLGYEETAFNRAEQLFKDESIMAVYDMLDHFCEFVNVQLSYIRRHKDCPNDINEAVSSLIFASARCADLPELPAIRKLFGERYGQRFATAAVELLPGNLVNREIKEKLSLRSVSDDVKYRLIDEIARDYCLQPEILALEYIPEKQQKVKEISGHEEQEGNNSKTEASSQMQTSDNNESAGKSIQADPLAISTDLMSSQCKYPNSDAICTSLSSSQQPSPVHMKAEKVGSIPQMNSPFQLTVNTPGGGQGKSISWTSTTTRKHNDERIKEPSSSESLPRFSEVVVYLDDIEELQSSVTKEDYQDQRLFKFKSPLLPKRGAVVDSNGGYDESYMEHEVQDEKLSSRSFSKTSNAIGRRSRRRSFSVESSSMKDIDHEVYYEKPCKSSPNHKHKSHHQRKLQKKTTLSELKRPKQPCCNCRFNTCSLESPCYFCTINDKEKQFPPRNQKTGQFKICDRGENLNGKCSCFQCCSNEDGPGCLKMDESTTLNQNLWRRSYDSHSGASVYEVFTTLPKIQKDKTTGTGEVKGSDSADNGRHVCFNSFLPRKETGPPYLRAMTMPQGRPREVDRCSIVRSNTLPFQNPNHVHPKLPEYDDIAAKFRALKKEHQL